MRKANHRRKATKPPAADPGEAAANGHAGRRLALLLGGALALATFLTCLGFVSQGRERPAGVYRPLGYYERVEAMVGNGAIEHLATAADGTGEAGPPWGRLRFRSDRADRSQETFHLESGRLRRDIARFNEEGSGGLFSLAADGTLQTNRWTHNMALPYPVRPAWRGSFSFGGEDLPALASDRLLLGFAGRDTRDGLPATERVVMAADEWMGRGGNRSQQRARAYELLGPSGQGAVLRFETRGDAVVMECVEGREAGLLVTLNGVTLNRGAREGLDDLRARASDLESNRFMLEPADRLRVEAGGREAVFRFGRFAGGAASRKWLENGREVNRVDSEIAEEIPYVRDLHRAAQRYLATHPDPESVRQPSVTLSLNRQLHREVQGRLDGFLADFDRRHAAVAEIERQPAAVAVVDALNGDVLALASYPPPDKLAELGRLAASGRIQPLTTRERERLARNQNLMPVVIGSTSKPLLAMAVWDTHPALRRLVIDEPGGPLRTLLGHPLASPLATLGPREIGPVDFLSKSSNAYTAALCFATLADPASYRLDGTGRMRPAPGREKPDFSRHVRGDLIPGGLDQPSLPAFRRLGELFDVAVRYDHGGDGMQRYEAGMLEPMMREMGLPDGTIPPAFADVAPAATNLELPSIDIVRAEFISFLVGGFTNRWSNVKLAEAYARVGSGTRVRARLAVPATERGVAAFPRLPVDAESLDLVRAGMRGAVEDGGTARRIAPSVARERTRLAQRGLELHVLAKTGTARRTANRECAAICLYIEIRPQGRTSGPPLAALATSIYLQDRAATRGLGVENSGVAALLANDMIPALVAHMEDRRAVREWQR